ncbi:MAG: RNA polymerase sigma factor [Planctomycetota bacterium]|jgi:RNA polymerase sigma-70 factor (ECF subfamily)
MTEAEDEARVRESDAAAIERCQAGDKEAFGVIVKRYAGAAAGAASLLLGNHEDALDASQEAFVRAWRHIRRFDSRRPFYPWYAAILRNLCISRLRRRARRRTTPLDERQPAASAESDPVLLAGRNERRDRVWQAIRVLSPVHREIIVMNHFQGMSYKEMAEALAIPIGTVMSRLHNARRALRDELTDQKE